MKGDKNNMKKKLRFIVFALMLIILVFVLAGCDNKNENITNNIQNTNSNSIELAKKVIQDFYDNYYAGNLEEAIKLVDFAGMEVYEELSQDGDFSNFKKLYEMYIKTEEWASYKVDIEKNLDVIIQNMNAVCELSNFDVNKISEDLYKVSVNIKEIDSEGKETNSENFEHYVFKVDNQYKIVYADK